MKYREPVPPGIRHAQSQWALMFSHICPFGWIADIVLKLRALDLLEPDSTLVQGRAGAGLGNPL